MAPSYILNYFVYFGNLLILTFLFFQAQILLPILFITSERSNIQTLHLIYDPAQKIFVLSHIHKNLF